MIFAMNRSWIALALAVSALLAAAPASAATLYVRTTGNDAADGLSRTTALRTIQAAVSKCTGNNYTIYVGPGVYVEEVLVGTGAGSAARSGRANRPNRIVGDVTGAQTGDPAGAVVIEGASATSSGVFISRRDHWHLSSLTIRGQNYANVYADRSSGVRVTECVLHGAPYCGVYGNLADNIQVESNTILRTLYSGHGVVLLEGRNVQRVAGNRMPLSGAEYLSSTFGSGVTGFLVVGAVVANPYGIMVVRNSTSDGATIEIENNVGSDYYVGVYAASCANSTRAGIAHNSFAGCYYGVYGHAKRGRVTLADNVTTDSYYGAMAVREGGTIGVSGLLTYAVAAQPLQIVGSPVSTAGLLSGDPLWRAPAAGDFSLLVGSPAIDAGLGAVTVATDITGAGRPIDGNGDGGAEPDLGAYESDASGGAAPTVVQWRERKPVP
jgi:hypothetical protein